MKEDRIGTRGPEGEQNRSSLILSWAGDKEVEVEDWLSRAAIGKLKEFDSIDQLGGLIGETMCIEDKTTYKTKLGKGIILILASPDKVIPSEIQVKIDNDSITVRLEESQTPVSSEWLGVADATGDKKKEQVKIREKEENRGVWCQNIPLLRKDLEGRKLTTEKISLSKTVGQTVGWKIGTMEKGKRVWIRKLKSKPARFLVSKGGPPSRVFTCPIQEGKDMEKGDSSGSIEYSEQKTGKKDGHGKVLEQGINFCIDLREQKFDNSSHTTGGSVSSTDEIGSQDTVIAETQVVENGGH
ncbi:hypothetical protein QYF36_020487 [Acer negundo]|nr:hypothetical protein QYF36_020487 [Acer negundo]